MIRGTTHPINVSLRDPSGAVYTLAEGEVLRFGLKRHPEDKECLIKKELTSAHLKDNVYVLILDPADTAELEFGTYYYDVGMQSGTTYKNVIECSKFKIDHNITLPEVIS